MPHRQPTHEEQDRREEQQDDHPAEHRRVRLLQPQEAKQQPQAGVDHGTVGGVARVVDERVVAQPPAVGGRGHVPGVVEQRVLGGNAQARPEVHVEQGPGQGHEGEVGGQDGEHDEPAVQAPPGCDRGGWRGAALADLAHRASSDLGIGAGRYSR